VCRRFGVSRKTGYKWIERYRAAGVSGLADGSRAPLHHPQAVACAWRFAARVRPGDP
jgi:transposase